MNKKISLMLCTVILAAFSFTISSFALTSDSSVMQPETSMPYYDGGTQEVPSDSGDMQPETGMPYYDDGTQEIPSYDDDNNDEAYDYGFNIIADKTTGYVFIILLGYILPVLLIIFSFIKFFKSKTRYKNAWFIMTAAGLLTSIFSTLFLLFTI